MSFNTEDISILPQEAGVYLMKDSCGDIIYVGKAKNLRNRIRSYFNPEGDKRLLTPSLLKHLHDIETIVTPNEHEAFLLENLLIKQHQPRYNVRLKDDKSYVSIKIALNHPFPRLEIMRRRKKVKEKSLFFGPFTAVKDVRETVKLIRRIFPLRNCKDSVFKTRTRPCLQYEIKRCMAPCVQKISKEDYAEILNGAIMFLKGEGESLVKEINRKMEAYSENLEFEKAAKLRDQVKAIENSLITQSVVLQKWDNRDIFGITTDEQSAVIAVLIYRNGNLMTSHEYYFKNLLQEPDEILSSVIFQFYDSKADIPDEILIDRNIEDRENMEIILSERKGKKVQIINPQRGDKLDLVLFAQKNAGIRLTQKNKGEKDIEAALNEIKKHLNLPRLPNCIEAFDISNIQGVFAVGSLVSFKNGEPDKANYKRFKIKTVTGSNDFAMMKEVIDRRYCRALSENLPLPDLLLVDGGKGQSDMAVEVLKELDIKTLPAASIAKSRSDSIEDEPYLSPYITNPAKADEIIKDKELKNPRSVDRFFVPGRKNPIFLTPGSQGLRLLMRVRDEAHRFAIEYHRKLMKQQRFSSILEEIPGIGPKQRKKLLRIFGSLQGLREATLESLITVGNLPEALAEKIYKFFRTQK